MTGTRPAEILRHLEQSGTDEVLLARFVSMKDGDAFAELVRRHGALVLGVCRRVTGHPQDAEDAFQATFLVLAQKAGSLRNVALLGNWLYGVAFRVASRAKRSARRRRAREVTVAVLPESLAPPAATSEAVDIQPILDEELAALSACYRDAIVLCDLRGASRAEAAVALGIPEGTLSSRLATGRRKLAARLTRRGVALSVTALPMAVAEVQAATGVPNELVTKTCGLVADWATGGVVPGPLARLTEGGFAVRKTLVFGVVMAFGVAGAVLAARPLDAPPNDPPKPPVVAEKSATALQPKEESKGTDPPTATYRHLPRMVRSFDCNLTGALTTMWSAKGTHFALLGDEVAAGRPGQLGQGEITSTPAVRVYWLEGKELSRLYPNRGEGLVAVAVQPDGPGIVTDVREYHLISGNHQLKFRAIKPSGAAEFREPIDLELPDTHGYAFSPDLKTFRTVAWDRGTSGGVEKLEAFEVDVATGRAKKSLMKLDHGLYTMSGNGKRIAVLDKDATKVTVYDLDRGAKVSEAILALPGEKLAELPFLGREAYQPQEEPTLVLSPNGKRLIVSRAIGQTYILNADTGEAMPTLEGVKDARVKPYQHAFTFDGRLLAMSAMTFKPDKVNLGNPPGPSGPPEPSPVWHLGAQFLTVWDTQTGKALKTWNRSSQVAFNPVRPLLAILEPNGEGNTRVGFWDFAAEVEKK